MGISQRFRGRQRCLRSRGLSFSGAVLPPPRFLFGFEQMKKKVKITKVDPSIVVNDVDATNPRENKTFLKRGNTFWITDPATVSHHDLLPPGNYIIKRSMFGEYFLEQVDPFTQPPKIYGDTPVIVSRILDTYKNRMGNTGVLLSGEKGAGKTLLGKVLSNRAASEGIPTLLINEPHCGEAFNQFIQSITQLCILFFDEFEKVYDKEKQEELLTLLEGVFQTRKLMILTCNDKYKIDSHMTNRPGRIFYSLEFKGLDGGFIREYYADNLLDPSHSEAVVNLATLFYSFNFDILKALAEEMNRYGETPLQAMKYLNAKPDGDSTDYEHSVWLEIDGKHIEEDIYPDDLHGNPMKMQKFSITHYSPAKKKGQKQKDQITYIFDFADLVSMNVKKGEFVFTKGNATLRLKRKEYKSFDLANGYQAAMAAGEAIEST
jgi:hypothetical protein